MSVPSLRPCFGLAPLELRLPLGCGRRFGGSGTPSVGCLAAFVGVFSGVAGFAARPASSRQQPWMLLWGWPRLHAGPSRATRSGRGEGRGERGEATTPRNLYELLGLTPAEAAASPEVLKQRQRALLRVCHPDVAGDNGAALTILVAEACEILRTADGRSAYEERLRSCRHPVVGGRPRQVRQWPSLAQVVFSTDGRADVPVPERGSRHAAEESLFVDEVACTACGLCVDLAPETYGIVDFSGSDMDNAGGGRTARVLQQWGNGEQALVECCENCPVGCIHWVPQVAVATLEYVCQADEYQAMGAQRRGSRWPCDNFDPLKGYQVWSPLDEGLQLFETGARCPAAASADPGPGGPGSIGVDMLLAAAWAELPEELWFKAREAVSS